MDGNGFDRLTQRLASCTTRRGILRTGTGLLAGAVVLGARHRAEAGLFTKNISVTVANDRSSGIQVLYESVNRRWSPVPAAGLDTFQGEDSELTAYIYETSGCPDPSTKFDPGYPYACGGDWTYRVWLYNPALGEPSAMVDSYASARDGAQPLPATFMAEGQTVEAPGFRVERRGDTDYKVFAFVLS
jgi:hypothetical protein